MKRVGCFVLVVAGGCLGSFAQDKPKPVVLRTHDGWISAVAFSPNGKRILAGSDDARLRIWDVKSGKALLVMKGHAQAIAAVT